MVPYSSHGFTRNVSESEKFSRETLINYKINNDKNDKTYNKVFSIKKKKNNEKGLINFETGNEIPT